MEEESLEMALESSAKEKGPFFPEAFVLVA